MKHTNPLKRLGEIQEQIAQLKSEAHSILESLRTNFDAALSGAPAAPAKRVGRPPAAAGAAPTPSRKRSSPLKGKKRPASPSGPLAPAAVEVIKAAGKPLSVGQLYDGLVAAGYAFTSSDPKKNLAARVYKLPGVKQVGPGVFSHE